MKLPEPVAWLDVVMQHAYTVDELADAEGTDFVPLFTETQMREALARQEAVMRQVIELMGPQAPECCGCAAEWNEAIKVLEDALK